jgi:hypothetical protein
VKATLKAYLYMVQEYDFSIPGIPKVWKPDLWAHKAADSESRIFIREIAVEVEPPEDFNPVPAQVTALEAEKARALAEYQKSVAEINERLSKLLCIQMSPTDHVSVA